MDNNRTGQTAGKAGVEEQGQEGTYPSTAAGKFLPEASTTTLVDKTLSPLLEVLAGDEADGVPRLVPGLPPARVTAVDHLRGGGEGEAPAGCPRT